MSTIFGRAYIDNAYRCAVATVRHKWLTAAYIADGNMLRLVKIPAAEARYFKPVPGYETAAAMAKAMLRKRTRAQMSQGARKLVSGIACAI